MAFDFDDGIGMLRGGDTVARENSADKKILTEN